MFKNKLFRTLLALTLSLISTIVLTQNSTWANANQEDHCSAYKQTAHNCCVNTETPASTNQQALQQENKTKTKFKTKHNPQQQAVHLQHKHLKTRAKEHKHKPPLIKYKPLSEKLRGIVVKNE